MMQVSVSGFAQMVAVLKKLADDLCQRRLVFTLEGGYHLQVDALSVAAIFDALWGNPIIDPLGESPTRRPGGFDQLIKKIKEIHHLK